MGKILARNKIFLDHIHPDNTIYLPHGIDNDDALDTLLVENFQINIHRFFAALFHFIISSIDLYTSDPQLQILQTAADAHKLARPVYGVDIQGKILLMVNPVIQRERLPKVTNTNAVLISAPA